MDEPRHFVAESYERHDAARASSCAAAAAAAANRRGTPVRLVWSLAAPDEELCLHLFEAPSPEVVAEIGVEAGLAFDRVWAAVPLMPLERRNG
jgi:hypothetical protein